MNLSDTITAVSTPKGHGAIGIVRVSGDRTLGIIQEIFVPHRKNSQKFSFDPHKMVHGSICEDKEILDDVLAVWMPRGASYTGDDLIEIHAHGNPVILNEILGLIIKRGARFAQPGEFTFRAFMNGKIDLAQAEAVSDLIFAKSRQAVRVANQYLRGAFSKEIGQIREGLLEMLVHTEAAIDFSSEDIEVFSNSEMHKKLQPVREKIKKILATYNDGRLLSQGASVAIVGRPNVGKSSLFNACLNIDRAIVTSVPGTTRDTVEEEFVYRGIAVRLIDTAGIRKTENVVENIGIDKALEKIKTADLVLLVLDVSEDFSEEDRMLIDLVASKKKILVLNKIDLGEKWKIEEVFIKEDLFPVIRHVSALSRSGIEKLLDTVYEELLGAQANSDTVFLTKSRHKLSLEKAVKYLDAYQEGLGDRRPLEFMALELREAVNELEAIIGKITTDDIYDKLFSSFCIGK